MAGSQAREVEHDLAGYPADKLLRSFLVTLGRGILLCMIVRIRTNGSWAEIRGKAMLLVVIVLFCLFFMVKEDNMR